MGVACAGRATSRTSRRVGSERPLTENWPHWEASSAGSAAVESLVMLLGLVRLLVVVCEWVLVLVLLHRLEAERLEPAVLVRVPRLPILLVLGAPVR